MSAENYSIERITEWDKGLKVEINKIREEREERNRWKGISLLYYQTLNFPKTSFITKFYNVEPLKPKQDSNDIVINIEDKKISLPEKLKHIAEAIIESKYILKLNDNWDDEGSSATDLKTYIKAINFVVKYSEHILNTPLQQVIDAPFIDIMRDGSISVLWDTDKAKFLIIFKKNENEFSYLYGEEKSTERPFQYAIKNDNRIDEITALWMSRNLT